MKTQIILDMELDLVGDPYGNGKLNFVLVSDRELVKKMEKVIRRCLAGTCEKLCCEDREEAK